jgi:alcohol dehydrogenase
MTAIRMKAYTYIEKGRFEMLDKPKPEILDPKDAIVRVTMSSICSSDLHIKHGSVPRAVPGITVGHEMVGVVEQVGSEVSTVKPGDRVTVNVETFCGECFFCKRGFVNNCTDPDGGWALGCRIDGGQTEFVRVPYADQGLNKIPDGVSDRQALFVGDVLATGFWAARISEMKEDDTVLIIGGGPTGICALLCVMLKNPKKIILCEKSPSRQEFIRNNYPSVEVVAPEECLQVAKSLERGGADIVLEVAGADDTFQLAWQCARPNAIVTVVALYDGPQTLPLPEMYGKNLTFKTGGVDGCDCEEILAFIKDGKIDTTPLITHTFPLSHIEEAYRLFESQEDGVMKIAIENC